MRTFNILIISLLFFFHSFSQNSNLGSIADSSSVRDTSSFIKMNRGNIKPPFSNNPHLSLQTGVSFFSIGKQSIFDKWVAPELTYSLTPKLNLTVGAVAMFSNYSGFQNNMNNEGVKTFSPNTVNGQYFLFAQGSYLLNDRITLRGTIMKEVPNKQINPYALNINRVGVDFKVSDNFTISADYLRIKGYNPSLMRNYNELNLPTFP